MSETGPAPAGKRFLIAGVLAVAAAAVVLIGLSVNRGREIEKERQSRRAEVKAGPRVPVATASRAPTKRSVTLNGEAHPYATVTLYAKVSGYLREIRVDKGDRVARGDLLAVIESPELDRQYDAAVADAKNKRIFAERERQLLKDGVVAEQDADNAVAAARVAEATAASLRSQKGYETIRAPFAGTVTARFVDPGTLLQSATTAQTSAQPLLTLSSTERLRIYVYLDQKNAALVKAGDRAVIADAVRPEARVEAKVSRMSDELDVKTRTRLVELDLDNRKGVFLAGGFVQVSLVLHAPPYVQVPVAALLMRGEKAFVGTVDGDNRVTFRPVETADSDGKMVRISSGIQEGARVILNPGTGIIDGEVVRPLTSEVK